MKIKTKCAFDRNAEEIKNIYFCSQCEGKRKNICFFQCDEKEKTYVPFNVMKREKYAFFSLFQLLISYDEQYISVQ